MNQKALVQSVERIYATAADELDCERLQALLPAYVDLEVGGTAPAKRFPAVHHHLKQCSDCAEEYAGLKQVVKLEAHGDLPETEEMLKGFEPAPVSEPESVTPQSTPQHTA